MDYSHAAYFTGTQQPYQFIGIPPLTPSHSNSAASEDYNTTSPPEVYNEPFSNEQHFQQNFDGYTQFNQQQQQQQQSQQFPGPPTPPNQHNGPHGLQQPSPAMNGVVNQALKAHPAEILPLTKVEPGLGLDPLGQRTGSNSDDDDLTPAQSRRKAQNRAAQRAFRERKERHVKDLEKKVASLEAAQADTMTENEQLKRDLQKMSTENEILRATSSIQGANGGGGSPSTNSNQPLTTGPMTYNPQDFYTDLLANHDNKTPSHRIATSASGEKLLAAGATWDLITGHDLFKKGLVDVADVSTRLKNQAKCDGQGPVFEEAAIIMAIEDSANNGSDELI